MCASPEEEKIGAHFRKMADYLWRKLKTLVVGKLTVTPLGGEQCGCPDFGESDLSSFLSQRGINGHFWCQILS